MSVPAQELAPARRFAGVGRRFACLTLVVTVLAGCGGAADQSLFDQPSAGSAGTVGTAGSGQAGSANAGAGGSGDAGTSAGGGSSGGSSTGGATSSGGASSGGSSGGPGCDSSCLSAGFECCYGKCVNKQNDIKNCGHCGFDCEANGLAPFCDYGMCMHETPCWTTQPCAGGNCCGDTCCRAGELCCKIPGPIDTGPRCSEPTEDGTCPMGCLTCDCVSPDTLIATPSGERPISELVVGDLVYTVHEGELRAAPILVAHRELVADHSVIRVTLEGGRSLEISGPHPTADGRLFSDLIVGGHLDGKNIVSTRRIPYVHNYTHDILPASDTGSYFAGGVRIGSTLSAEGASTCNSVDPPR